MPEGIDLPFPTAERQAEIEDELRLIYGDLRDPAYKALREYRVRQMVRAGRLLLELRTAKQGKWVCYLDHRTLPFCRRTAFNYIDRAYLHDVGGMEFATIANLRTPEVQHAAHQLRGSLHDAALAKQRRAAGEQRVHTLALFLIDKLTPEERRSVAADLTRCEAKALFDAMCDCVWPELPRAEPASEPPQPAQREPGLTHLLLDCGAYTAFKSDVAIDLEEYCGFLASNAWIKSYVSLDVICPQDPEEAAAASFENFQTMRARGLDPIPVYHVREPLDYLRRYLDSGSSVIGLGALSSKGEKLAFYDQALNVIAACGRPVAVHAFGDTSPMLAEFPFSSADSTTWLANSQVYANTSTARLNGIASEAEAFAARTYLEARRYARLERQIQESRSGFDLYLALSVGNVWTLPALRVVGHKKALVSYWSLRAQPTSVARLREFIDQPDALLVRPPFADKVALLQQARNRYHAL